VKSPASSTINQGRCHHSMHGHFIPPPHCAPDHFFLSVKSPSLTAAYAPAKKPMKLEPIVMIHGGSIPDTTPMSTSQACSTAPPIVPASQKTTQRTRMSADCRASFTVCLHHFLGDRLRQDVLRALVRADATSHSFPYSNDTVFWMQCLSRLIGGGGLEAAGGRMGV